MSKIRLTESQLKQIVNESVKSILTELDWRTYLNAAEKASQKRDYATSEYEKERLFRQYQKFKKAAEEAYSKNYGLENFDDEAIEATGNSGYNTGSAGADFQYYKRKSVDNAEKRNAEKREANSRWAEQGYGPEYAYQNVPPQPAARRNATQGELKMAGKRDNDWVEYRTGKQSYRDGAWGNDKTHAENARRRKEKEEQDYINQISNFRLK